MLRNQRDAGHRTAHRNASKAMACKLRLFLHVPLGLVALRGRGLRYDRVDAVARRLCGWRSRSVPQVTVQSHAEQTLLFYATDRRPATDEDADTYFANERGFFLRGGAVNVRADPLSAIGRKSARQA
jgi:hypothetical protein